MMREGDTSSLYSPEKINFEILPPKTRLAIGKKLRFAEFLVFF
jgi:hypothetical protein